MNCPQGPGPLQGGGDQGPKVRGGGSLERSWVPGFELGLQRGLGVWKFGVRGGARVRTSLVPPSQVGSRRARARRTAQPGPRTPHPAPRGLRPGRRIGRGTGRDPRASLRPLCNWVSGPRDRDLGHRLRPPGALRSPPWPHALPSRPGLGTSFCLCASAALSGSGSRSLSPLGSLLPSSLGSVWPTSPCPSSALPKSCLALTYTFRQAPLLCGGTDSC